MISETLIILNFICLFSQQNNSVFTCYLKAVNKDNKKAFQLKTHCPLDNRCMSYIPAPPHGYPPTDKRTSLSTHGTPTWTCSNLFTWRLPLQPVNRQTDMTENIAFPQTRYACGKKLQWQVNYKSRC